MSWQGLNCKKGEYVKITDIKADWFKRFDDLGIKDEQLRKTLWNNICYEVSCSYSRGYYTGRKYIICIDKEELNKG